MSKKLNCWEFKNCGREPGGLMADVLGECPVGSAMKYDGLNEGVGAGRACWMVPNSVCNHKRGASCYDCEFYKRVVFEQDEKIAFKYSSVKN